MQVVFFYYILLSLLFQFGQYTKVNFMQGNGKLRENEGMYVFRWSEHMELKVT